MELEELLQTVDKSIKIYSVFFFAWLSLALITSLFGYIIIAIICIFSCIITFGLRIEAKMERLRIKRLELDLVYMETLKAIVYKIDDINSQ